MGLCAGADSSYRLPAKEQAIALAFVQRWACWYCHRIMSPFYCVADGASATVEHKTPTSRGGPKVSVIGDPFRKGSNVVASCLRCNKAKADMTHKEFIMSRAFREIVGHDFSWAPPPDLLN